MILPNTWRVSIRFSAVSTSLIGTSVSITGSMPSAILSRLSAMFFIGGAERSEDAVLLLEQLHQVDRRGQGPRSNRR